MDIKQIVNKLNGEIMPIGETNKDNERFLNLTNHCGLVFGLLCEIIEVSKLKDSSQYSVKKSGEYAYKYLTEILGIKNLTDEL